ncbi:MAG: hypothetical protein COB12_10985 [Flavobacterium sp.]|nr:MAG: hypothetical protein COB12_10985 [Flavobacterium sp.]
MDKAFDVVYKLLKWASKVTGLTYHEINIIVYFIIIPVIFIILIDRIFKTHKLKIGFGIILLITLLSISDFKLFSTIIFNKSVAFLKWFSIIGLNYIQASVIICVIIPVIILGILFYKSKKRK